MRKVRARIKAPFGEIVMEADSPHKILETARKIKTNTGMCRTCNI